MRAALALAVALLVASGAVAPHAHAGPQGSHACQACLAGTAEEAARAEPDPGPLPPVAERLSARPGAAPVVGAPLGAIPGQSPPLA